MSRVIVIAEMAGDLLDADVLQAGGVKHVARRRGAAQGGGLLAGLSIRRFDPKLRPQPQQEGRGDKQQVHRVEKHECSLSAR